MGKCLLISTAVVQKARVFTFFVEVVQILVGDDHGALLLHEKAVPLVYIGRENDNELLGR